MVFVLPLPFYCRPRYRAMSSSLYSIWLMRQFPALSTLWSSAGSSPWPLILNVCRLVKLSLAESTEILSAWAISRCLWSSDSWPLLLLWDECDGELPFAFTNLISAMRSLFSTFSYLINSPIRRSQMFTYPSSLALANISWLNLSTEVIWS